MKKLYVCRGLPSSGKSFLAEQLYQKYYQNWAVVEIFSTDNYWLRPDGEYDWNRNFLRRAHEWNYDKFAKFVAESSLHSKNDTYVAILDNTNIGWTEFEHYIVWALFHEYEIEIVEPSTEWRYDVNECASKNSHGVPLETIQRMKDRWESTEQCLQKLALLKSRK